MTEAIVVGNAARDAEPFRGWLIGHFVPTEVGLRSTRAVEVKWATHARGETRLAWGASAEATSLSLLIRGTIRVFFATGQEILLAESGDYVLWPPGLAHRWEIETDETVVLTVRWPSRANDVVTS